MKEMSLIEIIKEHHILTEGQCDTDTFVVVPIKKLASAIQSHYKSMDSISKVNCINGQYDCKHIEENVINADCIWCNLTVLKKGLKTQRELRLKAEKRHKSRRLSEEEIKETISAPIIIANKTLILTTPKYIKKHIKNIAHAIFKAQEEKDG